MSMYYVLMKDGKIVDFYSEQDSRVNEVGVKLYNREIDDVKTVNEEELRGLIGSDLERYLGKFLKSTENYTNQALSQIEPCIKKVQSTGAQFLNALQQFAVGLQEGIKEGVKPLPDDEEEKGSQPNEIS